MSGTSVPRQSEVSGQCLLTASDVPVTSQPTPVGVGLNL